MQMTLKDFAILAGVRIIHCGPGWGGRYGYTTADHPQCSECGYTSHADAYQGWACNTFGTQATEALMHLLHHSAPTARASVAPVPVPTREQLLATIDRVITRLAVIQAPTGNALFDAGTHDACQSVLAILTDAPTARAPEDTDR